MGKDAQNIKDLLLKLRDIFNATMKYDRVTELHPYGRVTSATEAENDVYCTPLSVCK